MAITTPSKTKIKPNTLTKFLPILGWLPRYDKAWLAGDIVAGLSVWALMVPQSLGYADISGVPVQYGLYAAALALLIFPLFTTSRHVVTGPSSTISAVTGSAVLLVTTSGSPEAVQLVAAITVLAGLLYILLYILKMGWISNFLSESVLTGFIFGIGIDVVIGQLKKITGTTQTGETAWQKLFSWIQSLPDTNIPTLILGVSLLILLVLLHRYAPRVPGALVAVVIGIGAATLLPLAEMGVKLTGPVPSGLPSFVLPSLSFIRENLAVILPAAVGVMLVGFSESLAAARQYASKYHYDIDVDQEMLAQGMANTASGSVPGRQRGWQPLQERPQRFIGRQDPAGFSRPGWLCHSHPAVPGTVVCQPAPGCPGSDCDYGGGLWVVQGQGDAPPGSGCRESNSGWRWRHCWACLPLARCQASLLGSPCRCYG